MDDRDRQDVPDDSPESKVVMHRSPRQVQEDMDRGTSFDSMLFRLMNKADQSNWKRLRRAFPVQAAEYARWYKYGPEDRAWIDED
jgi:hypothetical protein